MNYYVVHLELIYFKLSLIQKKSQLSIKELQKRKNYVYGIILLTWSSKICKTNIWCLIQNSSYVWGRRRGHNKKVDKDNFLDTGNALFKSVCAELYTLCVSYVFKSQGEYIEFSVELCLFLSTFSEVIFSFKYYF